MGIDHAHFNFLEFVSGVHSGSSFCNSFFVYLSKVFITSLIQMFSYLQSKVFATSG